MPLKFHRKLYRQLKNQLQSFFLILALAVFNGRELIHPLLHAHHREISLNHAQYQAGRPRDIKKTDSVTKAVALEAVCPICSFTTHQATQTLTIQTELINCKVLVYSQPCKSLSFYSSIKPVSRGPPSAF